MTHSSSSAAPRLGVLLLAGGVILGLALGARHVQGLFLLPVSQAHGWPRETYGLAMALQNLVWGLAQPVAGWIADRRGSARVLAGGLLLYALGLAGMAFAHGALPFMLAAGLCIGLAQAGTTFGVIYAAMTRLAPPSQRGMALGVTGALGGLGQFLLVPGAQVAIDLLDWRGALWLMAALLLAALVLAPILRDRPSASAANEGSAPIALAVRQPGFWLLTAGFLTCGFQLAFIATHLPAYLTELGLGHQGVAALAIVALFNIAGTYACGVLGARWPRQRLLSVLYLLRAAAIAAFIAARASTIACTTTRRCGCSPSRSGCWRPRCTGRSPPVRSPRPAPPRHERRAVAVRGPGRRWLRRARPRLGPRDGAAPAGHADQRRHLGAQPLLRPLRRLAACARPKRLHL